MQAIAFVVWVIGWPLSYSVSASYATACGRKTETTDMGALITFVVWIVVAAMLWGKVK